MGPGKFIFRSVFGGRAYFTVSKDPNIKHDGKALVSQLKNALYSRTGSAGLTRSMVLEVTKKIPSMDSSDVLEVSYLLTRMNRKEGWIMDPRLSLPILTHFKANASSLSRDQQIRLIQVCSLSVNRNKLRQGGKLFQESEVLRSEVVCQALQSIAGRISDLPTSGLGALVSSLARQYDAKMDFFLRSISDILTIRIKNILNRSSSMSHFLARSDLQRTLPYVLLAFVQNDLDPPIEFSRVSLELYSNFFQEVSYEHLALLLHTLAGKLPIPLLLSEYIASIPLEELSVLDICRLVEPGCLPENTLRSLLTNPTWTIHAMAQFSRVADRADAQVLEHFLKKLGNIPLPKHYYSVIKSNIQNIEIVAICDRKLKLT